MTRKNITRSRYLQQKGELVNRDLYAEVCSTGPFFPYRDASVVHSNGLKSLIEQFHLCFSLEYAS
jgi:hypothetical protein